MTTTAPKGAPIIELRHASFGYADQAVVTGATLTIRAGEVVAILGPNGSGKSTLVRGLLGLNDHLGGDLELFGQPRESFSEFARLGYVPQRHTLSASVRATVAEIVAVGRLAHHRWWRPVLRSTRDAAIIDRALDVVGLNDRAHADVATLSGGQQRRVLIARALAADPDVLLMDEPTAGVDAANQQVLSAVLARLAERGTTMIIVTHELAALADIVTRIVVVQGGRIAFDGSRDEFATRTGEFESAADHHHHEHDNRLSTSTLPGAPSAGPLDPRGGGHR
ncbi:zinc transport system ATP-binding protein [Pedococcus dokdonensis]|uniref:Zinc transport system ATP-binding protein n=1 Tax=Pedococcus dokdonensis TaxID=443156 RepID=A0A1H0Q1E5_9MICO|nr:metal ABC transporter ATP-binding protein [Pedococcus dokdonensis]SDP11261.1 zinc transport system ATP-binding protein [Pedococcus dokdonensis]